MRPDNDFLSKALRHKRVMLRCLSVVPLAASMHMAQCTILEALKRVWRMLGHHRSVVGAGSIRRLSCGDTCGQARLFMRSVDLYPV